MNLDLTCQNIIIYDPRTLKVIAVISSKITLRERIAQTGYWKLKLMQDEVTKHIKVFFITPDEDRTLKTKIPAKKGRAIVEVDTDGSYVMSEEKVEESDKVKMFDNRGFEEINNIQAGGIIKYDATAPDSPFSHLAHAQRVHI